MSNPRHDSVLFQLTEEQQAQIYDWLQTLGYSETAKKLADPSPDGFDLKTHRSSLHRFFMRYSQKLRRDDVAAAKENRSETNDSPVLLSGAEEAFHHAGFQLATSPMSTDSFGKVSRWLHWQKDNETKNDFLKLAERQLALGEKRFELDREKFQLNATRLALQHSQTLQEIHRNPTLDDEDKIRAAREHLFGKAQSQ